MDVYSYFAARSIKQHQRETGTSSETLARLLNIKVGTFYAKLQGVRPWTVKELTALARYGVALPPLDADLTRKGAK